jgi:hypothetical protein
MGQAVPTTLFHGQALRLLLDLRAAYQSGMGSVDEVATQVRGILAAYEETAGAPFFNFDAMVEGEPPLSSKINRLWANLQHDVNILQQQVDIGRAAAVLTHNLIATEVLKAKSENARVSNKLKTLLLYSDAVDANTVIFGDYFHSEEFLDHSRVPSSERALLLGDSYLVIPKAGIVDNFAGHSQPKVLPTSNGFLGNLHEVVDAGVDQTAGEVIFKAESDSRSDLWAMLDGEPNTWLEYENVLVSESDRRSANNFGFSYRTGGQTEATADWAAGPADGLLRLDLEFDLGSPQSINYIAYVPFNLEDNANYPVKVAKIQISGNGTDWEEVRPRGVYVGTTPNLQAARSADEVVIGQAIWVFPAQVARFVRVFLEQAHAMVRRIGHVYYENAVGQRVDTGAPSIDSPEASYAPNSLSLSEHIEKREVFNAKRWAIGIRDIAINNINYAQAGVIVTQPLRVGGVVDRLVLEAEVTIPEIYDESVPWVAFYVTPDDGANWFPIARVQDDYLGIPEVIAFNDPVADAFREPGVGYHSVPGTVTTLRLKAILSRPAGLPTTTPIFHSYRLKATRR